MKKRAHYFVGHHEHVKVFDPMKVYTKAGQIDACEIDMKRMIYCDACSYKENEYRTD
jgi:hypothetical protein